MSSATVRWASALVLLSGLAGCAPDRPPPPCPIGDPSTAWDRRLGAVVSATGEVDYAALRADARALRDFLGWVAVHGPETDGWRQTDDDRRLAFHLNVLNAVMLWLQIDGDPVTTPFPRLRFALDGDVVRLDRHVLHVVNATYEEPLAVAALACPAKACPPLADTLYEKKGLDATLGGRMRSWAAAGTLAWEEGGELVFSPALRGWTKAFARYEGLTTPCAIVAPYADEALAARLGADPACPFRWGGWEGPPVE